MSEDPMERKVSEALATAGIKFGAGPPKGTPPGSPFHLDFHLHEAPIFIEVKQFHSERIAAQMAMAPNVIAIQGREAVDWFCSLLAGAAAGRLAGIREAAAWHALKAAHYERQVHDTFGKGEFHTDAARAILALAEGKEG